MKKRYCETFAAISGILAALSCHVNAELPENYLERWDNPAVQKRIEAGIEKNRKSDATLTIVDSAGKPVTDAEVKIAQTSHEFLFGCNLFVLGQLETPELNRKYERSFTQLFNFATLPFYWGDLEPEQGKPRYAEGASYIWRRPPPDRLLAWCKAHGITPKGHALLYVKNKFMPEWTIRDDPKAFMEQARRHVNELAGRYGDEIPVWDVINEEISRVANPDKWPAVPDDYAVRCFQQASRLFSKDVALLINDGTKSTHVTTDKCMANVKQLLDCGVRVDGIGIQFHYFNRKSLDGYLNGDSCDPNTFLDTYELLAGLGLPLWITEITIGSAGDDGLAIQERVTRDIYRLWFASPKMAGITWWNLGDGTAYGNEGIAGGGLVDEDFKPKPAYEVLDQLINHDWKTSLETKSSGDGTVKFRGFHGDYKVAVTAAGQTKEFELTVGSGEPVKVTLTMP